MDSDRDTTLVMGHHTLHLGLPQDNQVKNFCIIGLYERKPQVEVKDNIIFFVTTDIETNIRTFANLKLGLVFEIPVLISFQHFFKY